MAIFRVRNLLVQVLPLECKLESCDLGSGCGEIEASVVEGTIDECGIDSIGPCDGDSIGPCDGDDDSIEPCGDDDSIDPCDDDDDSIDPCDGDDDSIDPCDGISQCTAFLCSLHFETPGPCDATTPLCFPRGITVDCEPYGRTLLCPAGPSLAVDPLLPALVCFQSNEPKINPNSLADLGLLRRQLAVGLKTVVRRERALAKALSPKTTREIESAEAHLTSALRDLKQRKQFIQARAAKSKKAAESRKKPAPAEAAPAEASKKPAKKAPAKKGGRGK
jgi:hypothetical protein